MGRRWWEGREEMVGGWGGDGGKVGRRWWEGGEEMVGRWGGDGGKGRGSQICLGTDYVAQAEVEMR